MSESIIAGLLIGLFVIAFVLLAFRNKLASARILQNSFFKQLKFLAGSTTRVQDLLLISETGTLGIEKAPMDTGYAWLATLKSAWSIDHSLSIALEKHEGLVLPVTERSRHPLDPFNHCSACENSTAEDVKKVGRERYREAYARMADDAKESQNVKMVKTALWLVFIAVGIGFIGLLIRG